MGMDVHMTSKTCLSCSSSRVSVRSVPLDRVHSPTHRARAGGGDPGTADCGSVPQAGMRHGGWAARAPLQP
eukprot:scaffold26288_cov111-Isochrysis_galbana.AAC.9